MESVQSALSCIASPLTQPPETIRRAQEALLRWEETDVDRYAVSLASLIGVVVAGEEEEEKNNNYSARRGGGGREMMAEGEAATLRLAAALTLKATITRRWKDRGRGGGGGGGKSSSSSSQQGGGGGPKQAPLLSEGVKDFVRRSMLNLILGGRATTAEEFQRSGDRNAAAVAIVVNPNELTRERAELILDRALQTNAASLLSKAARMDLPLKWRELIPSLVEGTRSANDTLSMLEQRQRQAPPSSEQLRQQQITIFRTVRCNVMNALEAVLAEISTQRLLVNKKYRNSIASEHLGSVVEHGLMPSLRELESSGGAVGGGGGGSSDDVVASTLEYATVTSRAVSHMMISSFSKLVEESPSSVDRILTLLHAFVSRWLPRVSDGKSIVVVGGEGASVRPPLTRLLLVHCELIVDLQRSHPAAFARYLTPFLDLFHSSLVSILDGDGRRSGGGGRRTDRFAIAFLSFLANVVGASEYYAESDAGVGNVAATFFAPSLVQSLSRRLLLLFSIHICPVQSNDHDDNGDDDDDDDDDRMPWRDDPEAFYHWENRRSGEDDVGCAAQNLFLALAESPRSDGAILPWFVGLLTNVVSQRLATELEAGISAGIDARIVSSALPLGTAASVRGGGGGANDDVAMEIVLQWDAIYTAAGLAGSILERCPGFEFRSWFDASLGDCLALLLRYGGERAQTRRLPILQRRIIWLLSCNAHHVPIRSPLNPLGMLASAISATDVCVGLTAVQALDALLPQCEDVPQLLNSIIEPTSPALYRLVNESSEVESRSACLDLLSNLICVQSGGSLTNEILNTIVAPLPSIWDGAVDQNLLLKRNVLAILSCTASFVGPESCAVLYPLALPMIDESLSKEENVFLVEEATKIWWVFLRLSRTYDPLLGKLFVRAGKLSEDFEHLMVLMRVTEHYIILGGANFLNDHAATIQTVLCNVVGEVRPRGTAYVCMVIEALLRSFPVEGGLLLNSCGVLKTFVEACAGSYFEDEKCEPDRVIVLYLTALARVLLSAPDALQQQLPVTVLSGAVFGEQELISLFLLKFRVAGNGAHGLMVQKLWALLLLSLYPPCPSAACCDAVLRRSNSIFEIFAHVLENVNPDGTNVLLYEVGYDEEEETVHVGEDIYDSLLQEQRAKDTVISISIHEAVSSKLSSLPNVLGQKYREFCIFDNATLRKLEEVIASNRG